MPHFHKRWRQSVLCAHVGGCGGGGDGGRRRRRSDNPN